MSSAIRWDESRIITSVHCAPEGVSGSTYKCASPENQMRKIRITAVVFVISDSFPLAGLCTSANWKAPYPAMVPLDRYLIQEEKLRSRCPECRAGIDFGCSRSDGPAKGWVHNGCKGIERLRLHRRAILVKAER
jgi:hypothetical protein